MPVQMLDDVAWDYTVTVANRTGVELDEITIFFATRASSFNPPLIEKHVLPDERRVFRLGPCPDLVSYAMAAYIGRVEVAVLPPNDPMDPKTAEWGPGPVTPEKASIHNSTDKFLCEDSWRIG